MTDPSQPELDAARRLADELTPEFARLGCVTTLLYDLGIPAIAAALAAARAEERERWAKRLDEDVRELMERSDHGKRETDREWYKAQAEICQSIAGALRSEN